MRFLHAASKLCAGCIADVMCTDSWQGDVQPALSLAMLLAGPNACISEVGEGFSIDFVAPEMVTANKQYWEYDLEELEGQVRNVVAADAWAVGAILYYAATGSEIVLEDPLASSAGQEYKAARRAYLLQVHAGWKVKRKPHCQD